MKKHLQQLLAIAAFSLPIYASAQTLTGVQLSTDKPAAGAPVTATIQLEDMQVPNCGLRLNWGDGSADENFKINNRTKLPKQLTHTYAKPGSYTVNVWTKKVGSTFGCRGKDAQAVVQVQASAKPEAASISNTSAASKIASTTQAGADLCPTGSKLLKRNAATGEFSCQAAAGALVPTFTCPGNLNFYEKKAARTAGCSK